MAFAPVSRTVRGWCAALLGVFLAYSLLVMWLVFRRRERARAIYLGALAADLLFLYFLFGRAGGIAGPFMPAAFLLTALTAFHYGPTVGISAVCAALAAAVLNKPGVVLETHWSALPLVLAAMVLTAACVSWLARRAAGARRRVKLLHKELRARERDIKAVRQRYSEVQDHLVHSERLATIGRMSAEMAHQVRNPLSSISLNLELIEDEIAYLPQRSANEVRKLTAAIHKEIDGLAGVTESYLRFAKMPPFRWERVDFSDIVRGISVFVRPQIERRAMKLSQRLVAPLPPVRIDRRQFKFAVLNVLENALDAMSPGGRLRIKTGLNNGSVELTIADTGSGIPAENMERIFEPFFTTKQSGTGLGLSLARRIIESHGGRIRCESIRQVGTTFTISLPVEGRGNEEDSGDDPNQGNE